MIDNPKKCEECDVLFSTKTEYLNHMRIHDLKKAFSCKYCQKHFNKESYLVRHFRKKHENEATLGNICGDNGGSEEDGTGSISQDNSALEEDGSVEGSGYDGGESISEITDLEEHFRGQGNKEGAVGDSENTDGDTFCRQQSYEEDYDDLVPASYVESQLSDK